VSTPPLFFVEHLPATDRVRLDGAEGRHAARVKRLSVGEHLRVADGLGAVADCVVREVLPDGLDLEVVSWGTVEPPDPYLVVVQALAKGERAELAVELATELGADEIVPWAASRSITQWQDERVAKGLERWRRTAREAAKQSRRPRVPIVTDLASGADVAARIGAGFGLVLHETADQPLATASLPGSGEIVVVIGPEGGVTDEELADFARAGAAVVRLGDPVLRTSTAGAAALAVLSVRVGRWTGG
jgi:16S rRNA (uracil1498-N3)-methyltransferase